MRKLFAAIVAMFAAVALATPASAQLFGGKKDFIYEKGGYAINGHDTVAYWDLDANDLKDNGLPNPKAVKGDPQFSHDWNGATWIFASAENRDKFAADPERYAPQYNGYCAYAAAKGNLARTDANAWRVIDGKLYLNFNSSIQRKWVKDIPGHIQDANSNWSNLSTKLAAPAA